LHVVAPDETGRVRLIPTALSACLPGTRMNPFVGAKPSRRSIQNIGASHA
jgi:hypothetical protein